MGKDCAQCSATTKSGDRCKLNVCASFPYCWIHLKSKQGLQVKKSEIQGAGKGLFYVGKEPIKPGKKITLYSAKEVSAKPISGDYVLEVGKNKFIDSKKKSNYPGRYINDPRGTGKRANVRFGHSGKITKVTAPGGSRETFPIITSKRIKPNTELLLSYGRSFKI